MITLPAGPDARRIGAAFAADRSCSNRPTAPAAETTNTAEALRIRGDLTGATTVARVALSDDPYDINSRSALVLALAAQGDAVGCGLHARRAVAVAPAAPEAWRSLALAEMLSGRVRSADRAARRALDLLPAYGEGLATLALVRMRQELTEMAEALFRAAELLTPAVAEIWSNHAALALRRRKGISAERMAARAARLKPFLAAPWMLSGGRAFAARKWPEAVAAFAAAAAADPGALSARVNLAEALRRDGRPQEAVAVCRRGLELHPHALDLHNNLGAALYETGDRQGALLAYRTILAQDPTHAEARHNAGVLLAAQGRQEEAAPLLRAALNARPDDRALAGLLLSVLLDLDAAEEAAAVLDASPIRRNPEPGDLALIGRVLLRQGRVAEAEAAFFQACRVDSPVAAPSVDPLLIAAAELVRAGAGGALPFTRRLIRKTPQSRRAWALFAQALRRHVPAAVDADLEADILAAFSQPGAEKAHLVAAALATLRLDPCFASLEKAVEDSGDLLIRTTSEIAARPLLRALLTDTIIPDRRFERTMTALRAALLLRRTEAADRIAGAALEGFLCALARQSRLNEFVFAETAAETAAVAQLEQRLTLHFDQEDQERDIPVELTALYAAYRPLSDAPFADRLAEAAEGREFSPDFARLMESHVGFHRQEQAIARTLPRLTAIDDPVSRAVRAQYEENPYPRWLHAALLDAPRPAAAVIGALLPHVRLAPDRWAAPEILVAGCGSGRESLWAANHFANARVLAVDLSLASLAYAARQSRALGFGDIEYAQADLLALAESDRRFDMIHSVGVLHHTGDIESSWRKLLNLLKPDGLMKVGLYSRKARRPIAAAQALIRQHGFAADLNGIRAARALLSSLPADHPTAPIPASGDFHSAGGCRDLLFHVQEICVDLTDIDGWLNALGLELLGFQFDDPQIMTAFRRRFGAAAAPDRIDLWRIFEEERPETFGGLYQFWTRRRS